jgi:DNA excision repair protein ERCC-8
MNHLLFDRSTGALRPKAFARVCLSQRLNSIQLASRLQFNGGEKEIQVAVNAVGSRSVQFGGTSEAKIWAHQAGVNALGIDIEGRMLVTRSNVMYQLTKAVLSRVEPILQ